MEAMTEMFVLQDVIGRLASMTDYRKTVRRRDGAEQQTYGVLKRLKTIKP
jgi:hypothetical protein